MTMKTRTFSLHLFLLLFAPFIEVHPSASQELNSIKLFDATPVYSTGPATAPEEPETFASSTLILNFTENDSAVISSTPDGKGPIVIDNFMVINGRNICEGLASTVEQSCFGGYRRDPRSPKVIGKRIETVLKQIPPVNVSSLIPVGPEAVVFELRDLGIIAGNTDLFLVTTHTVSDFGPEDLPPEPITALQPAFSIGVSLIDLPFYDTSGRMCPAPAPPQQCQLVSYCDANGRNCVPHHFTCTTCGGTPPPDVVGGDDSEADEPQGKCPVSFLDPEPIFGLRTKAGVGLGGEPGLLQFQQTPTISSASQEQGDGHGTPDNVCFSDLSDTFRRLAWQTSHNCYKPKLNPEQEGCRPYVNVQLVRSQPGMESYTQPGSRWGRPEMIEALNRIGAEWNRRHDSSPPIRTGDISFLGGGDHPGHLSHEDGLDVDILAVGKDDTGARVDILKAPEQYSQDRTRELIQIIRSNGVLPVQMLFFDDKQLQAEGLCTPASRKNPNRNDHTNHLHVRFRKP